MPERKPPSRDLLPPADAPAPGARAVTPRVTSAQLFGQASVLFIDHEGETYSLRRTRLGKLILTK